MGSRCSFVAPIPCPWAAKCAAPLLLRPLPQVHPSVQITASSGPSLNSSLRYPRLPLRMTSSSVIPETVTRSDILTDSQVTATQTVNVWIDGIPRRLSAALLVAQEVKAQEVTLKKQQVKPWPYLFGYHPSFKAHHKQLKLRQAIGYSNKSSGSIDRERPRPMA